MPEQVQAYAIFQTKGGENIKVARESLRKGLGGILQLIVPEDQIVVHLDGDADKLEAAVKELAAREGVTGVVKVVKYNR